jgi:hypothetical protein
MPEKHTYEELMQRIQELERSEIDRKRLEAERLRLEQDYRTLFREMLDGFALHELICDTRGKPVDYRFLGRLEGAIRVESKIGLGSRFFVALPLNPN